MYMKKITKLVKLKILTRRIGIEVVIMKKLCKQEVHNRDENASVQGKWFEKCTLPISTGKPEVEIGITK